MQVGEAKKIAKIWTLEYAKSHAVIGAVLTGSTTVMKDDDFLPESSDVDVNLIVKAEQPPEKLGKFLFQNVLLEVTPISFSEIYPAQKLLSRYELAGNFRKHCVLLSCDENFDQIVSFVSQQFARPEWIRARYQAALKKIEKGMRLFDDQRPVVQNINCWLFPAGICTHVILVAAMKNPTVRLRYLSVRPVLYQAGLRGLYEQLLQLLGCEQMTRERVEYHLTHLEEIFDLAAEVQQSDFPFARDITVDARKIAIGGSWALIQQGDYREAVFWIVATFERCHKIFSQDASELHRRYLPQLMELLSDLNADSNEKIQQKIAAISETFPRLAQVSEQLIANSSSFEIGGSQWN